MELELGLKLTSVADEFTSDFQFAKDRAGPVFLSRETDAMFVLTAHLEGYRRRNIKIDINEDGSLIGISGEKQVKETVMVGWKVYKKDTEIKGFKKVFRIPEGVILDKIKAKFNEDESTLTITMPKKVKGIRGTAIEEVKEKQELDKQGSGSLLIVDDKSPKIGTSDQEKDEKLKAKIGEDDTADVMPSEGGKKMPKKEIQEERPCYAQKVHDLEEEGQPMLSPSIHARVETEMPKEDAVENQKNVDQELDRADSLSMKQKAKEDLQETDNIVTDRANDIQEEESLDEGKEGPSVIEAREEAAETEPGKAQDGEDKPRGKRCKMCLPIVAGSTLLLSFVVFVIQIIRSKNQTRRRD